MLCPFVKILSVHHTTPPHCRCTQPTTLTHRNRAFYPQPYRQDTVNWKKNEAEFYQPDDDAK